MAKKVKLTLNPIQQTFHDYSYGVKRAYFVAGRGTGKSSYGIGTKIRNIVHFLPRSKWLIVAESYRSMLENTLPSTIRALESFGYYRDVHYVIGIKPPKLWETSYESPLKGYKNTITFWNGASFLLVSQDSAATSPRGLNTDGVLVDEALNLDKEHFDEEIAPTVRANQTQFSAVPFHLGMFFFSSMPYSTNAEWLTHNIEYYNKDGVDQEKRMNSLINLQIDFLKEQSIIQKQKLWSEINKVRSTIRWYPKNVDRISSLYIESNAFDNIRVLGYDYIYNLYKTTSTIRFMTEIMNKRMTKPEGGFYAKFDRDVHTYKRFFLDRSKGVFDYDRIEEDLGETFNIDKAIEGSCLKDNDCISSEPLYLGVDFGGNINCAVVGQFLETRNQFNFIKDFFVKTPETLDELAENIAKYYYYHQNKLVYFYYDRFGNQDVGNSKMTYAQQFASILEDKGFTVQKLTVGLNPKHMDKYLLWSRLLSEESGVPVIRFNYYNCRDLIYSIEGAELEERRGEWRKKKSNEGKNLETEEREQHLSDACDYVVFSLFRSYLSQHLDFIPNQTR
jgi:hypothetical protein